VLVAFGQNKLERNNPGKYRGALVLLDLQSPASRTVLADDLPAEPQSAAAQQYSEVRLAHSL